MAQSPCGACVIDPARGVVVASAVSSIDLCSSISPSSVCVPGSDGWSQPSTADRDGTHPLAHACMNVVEAVAAMQRTEGTYDSTSPGAAGDDSEQADQQGRHPTYLCTGLEVVVTGEPCLMCVERCNEGKATPI